MSTILYHGYEQTSIGNDYHLVSQRHLLVTIAGASSPPNTLPDQIKRGTWLRGPGVDLRRGGQDAGLPEITLGGYKVQTRTLHHT